MEYLVNIPIVFETIDESNQYVKLFAKLPKQDQETILLQTFKMTALKVNMFDAINEGSTFLTVKSGI